MSAYAHLGRCVELNIYSYYIRSDLVRNLVSQRVVPLQNSDNRGEFYRVLASTLVEISGAT